MNIPLVKYLSIMKSALQQIRSESIVKELIVGKKLKKTKREIKLSKMDSITRHKVRRMELLNHQHNSFKEQLEALNRLSPKERSLGYAQKRSIKKCKLGKKGGLITA